MATTKNPRLRHKITGLVVEVVPALCTEDELAIRHTGLVTFIARTTVDDKDGKWEALD